MGASFTDRQCLELARRAVAQQYEGTEISQAVLSSLGRVYLERELRESKIASLKKQLRSSQRRGQTFQALLEANGLGPVPVAADGRQVLVGDALAGEDGSRWVCCGFAPANGPYNVIVKSMAGRSPRPMREVRPEWMRHAHDDEVSQPIVGTTSDK